MVIALSRYKFFKGIEKKCCLIYSNTSRYFFYKRYKEEQMRKENGITLIALIIIVLLIFVAICKPCNDASPTSFHDNPYLILFTNTKIGNTSNQ